MYNIQLNLTCHEGNFGMICAVIYALCAPVEALTVHEPAAGWVLQGAFVTTCSARVNVEPEAEWKHSSGRSNGNGAMLAIEASTFRPRHLSTMWETQPLHTYMCNPPPNHVAGWCIPSGYQSWTNIIASMELGCASTEQHSDFRRWLRLSMLDREAESQLYKNFDAFHVSLKWDGDSSNCLLNIHVPGLEDQRPNVSLGDMILMRLAVQPNYAMYVCRVVDVIGSKATVTVRVPETFPKSGGTNHFDYKYSMPHMQLSRGYRESPPPKVHIRFVPPPTRHIVYAVALERAMHARLSILPTKTSETPMTNTPARLDSSSDAPVLSPRIHMQVNEEQELAISGFLQKIRDRIFKQNPNNSAISVLFGPPGTGKTRTVVELAARILEHYPNMRILACAPAPFAADALASALGVQKDGAGLKPGEMYRINEPNRPPATVKANVHMYCIPSDPGEDAGNIYYKAPSTHAANAIRVMVCTCLSSQLITNISWRPDVILFDEAAQASVPEAIVPLSFLEPHGCVLFAGDPCVFLFSHAFDSNKSTCTCIGDRHVFTKCNSTPPLVGINSVLAYIRDRRIALVIVRVCSSFG